MRIVFLLFLLIGSLLSSCSDPQGPSISDNPALDNCKTFKNFRSACVNCPKAGLTSTSANYTDSKDEGASAYLMEVDPRDELKDMEYERRPLALYQFNDSLPQAYTIQFKANIDKGRYAEFYINKHRITGNDKLSLLFYSKGEADPQMSEREGLYILRRDNNVRLDKSLQSQKILKYLPLAYTKNNFTAIAVKNTGKHIEIWVNGQKVYEDTNLQKDIVPDATFITNGRFEIKDMYYCEG